MVAIDYQGGQHGNYLEFVCNRHLANVATAGLPFDNAGRAHSKIYLEDKVFEAKHYFSYNKKRIPLDNVKVISIKIQPDDLLPLTCISLLRAGNHNIKNDELEVNTYHKLNNGHYRNSLDQLIENFFEKQARDSYRSIKDSSWPDIETTNEFYRLPKWIQEECVNVHGIKILRLDRHHPHCPRNILREFYKIGFLRPEQSGFMTRQREMYYNESCQVIHFDFGSFYDLDRFVEEIENIGEFVGSTISDVDGLISLHREFLLRQPYKDVKIKTDRIFDQIVSGLNFEIGPLELLQESYLDAKLEQYYNRESSQDIKWFQTAQQVRDFYEC